jgi:sugar transferase EpsL
MPKRIFDFILALILATLLLPLMAATAAAVAWKMGFPALFRQVRPGLHGRPFRVLKFRTMAEAVGADGQLLPDEQRLTKLGALLRRFSLDELPQLFNVIRGDMSLVGPRPLLMEYLPLYSAEQMRRHDVRPGITGWAQVNGRNALPWEERFRMDVWYVDNQTMLFDLRILALTALRVLRSRGISEPGQATMTPFRGSSDKVAKSDLDQDQ